MCDHSQKITPSIRTKKTSEKTLGEAAGNEPCKYLKTPFIASHGMFACTFYTISKFGVSIQFGRTQSVVFVLTSPTIL